MEGNQETKVMTEAEYKASIGKRTINGYVVH